MDTERVQASDGNVAVDEKSGSHPIHGINNTKYTNPASKADAGCPAASTVRLTSRAHVDEKIPIFTPFGAGRKGCVGQYLAMVEMKV